MSDKFDAAAEWMQRNTGHPESPQARTPYGKIVEITKGWEGEAKENFDEHLESLAWAMQYQEDFVGELRLIITLQSALTRAAQEEFLNILDDAIEHLLVRAEARRAAEKNALETVVDFIKEVHTGATIGGSAGPKGAAVGAIAGAGSFIVSQSSNSVGGEDPFEILQSMKENIGDLENAISSDQEQVREALDKLNDYLFGNSDRPDEDLLPAPINYEHQYESGGNVIHPTPDVESAADEPSSPNDALHPESISVSPADVDADEDLYTSEEFRPVESEAQTSS